MTDEEFVRANWELVHTGAAALHLSDYSSSIVTAGEEFRNWAAAAEFTRERLEQIRQLEAEVEMVKNDVDNMRDVVIQRQYGSDWTVEYCRWTRVLARLDAALTDLKRGMKPTP